MAGSHNLGRHGKQALKAILRLLVKILLLTLWGAFSIMEVVGRGLKEAVERINK